MDKEQQFFLDSVEHKLFTVHDINNDNSCLFRSLANYFYYAMPSEKLAELKKLENWGNNKKLEDIDKTTNNVGQVRDKLSRYIYDTIVDYIETNPDSVLDDTGITIRDYIPMVHGMDYDTYLTVYRDFPADINRYSDEEWDGYDRWGSQLEVLVISKIVGCSIVVMNSQKWNKEKNKVEIGKIVNSKPQKDVRFKIYQIVNPTEINNKLPIFLIWKKASRGGAHYMVAYPNNINEVMAKIQNYI